MTALTLARVSERNPLVDLEIGGRPSWPSKCGPLEDLEYVREKTMVIVKRRLTFPGDRAAQSEAATSRQLERREAESDMLMLCIRSSALSRGGTVTQQKYRTSKHGVRLCITRKRTEKTIRNCDVWSRKEARAMTLPWSGQARPYWAEWHEPRISTSMVRDFRQSVV
jgi:hypothetical protein